MANNKRVGQKSNVSIGTMSHGWVCFKEYKRFFMWKKTTRSGKVIRECFFKEEVPMFSYES